MMRPRLPHESLAPVVGDYAKYLFAVGLFGAAMLAMGVLPLATAYSLSEALGFEKGLSRSFREAPIFLGIFTALILIGAVVALIPGIPQIKLLLFTQCINGAACFPISWSRSSRSPTTKRSWANTENSAVFNIFASRNVSFPILRFVDWKNDC